MDSVDFSKFSAQKADSEPKFTVLAPGQYLMRTIGFQRNKTKGGDDSLVFKLLVLKGLTPGTSPKGDSIWFINLTQKGARFVKEAVTAMRGGDWTGNLFSDDEVKESFLGRVITTNIVHEHRNGRIYASVTRVAPKNTDEFEHEPAEVYWARPALGRGVEPPSTSPKPDERLNSPSAGPFTEDPDGGNQTTFDDDDIPF